MPLIKHLIMAAFFLLLPSACGSFADFAQKKSDGRSQPANDEKVKDITSENAQGKTETETAVPDPKDVGGEDQEVVAEPDADEAEAETVVRSEPCQYRYVDHTNGNRLLVSDQAAAGATVLDRLHPGDSLQVLSRQTGRSIRDDILGVTSNQWLEIIYQSANETRKGWVNELYATCAARCPYVEFYNLGTDAALVRESPYDKNSKTVHHFYNHYMTTTLDQITDGIEVKNAAGDASSRSWYQVEYYDGTNPTPSSGWVSAQYAFCSQGRLQSRDGKLRLPTLSRILSSDEKDHTDRGSVYAWDISAPYGTPIHPISPGVVKYAGCNNAGKYGCWTQIAHDNGMMTNMAHMIEGSIKVANGQRVTQDTVLGLVGWTGFTTFGPHTHLEIFVNGSRVLLGNYFNKDAMLYCQICSLKN